MRDGIGIYTWTNGKSYTGGFFEGKFHGKGMMKDSEGNRLEGVWELGKIVVNNKKEVELTTE